MTELELEREAQLRANPPVRMNMKEAAIVSGLSYSTIQRATKSNELPCFRRGKIVLIDRDDLLKWCAPNNPSKEAA